MNHTLMEMPSSSLLKKLEIGSGNRPKTGYVHLDIKDFDDGKTDIIWDATKTPYPFKDEEFSEIYSQWVLEHFALRDLERIVLEWKRLLKLRGKIVAITNNQLAHNRCLKEGKITWTEWIKLTYGIKENEDFIKKGLPIPKKVSVFECHKSAWSVESAFTFFLKLGFDVTIKSGWKCREVNGELKCPGLTIEATKL